MIYLAVDILGHTRSADTLFAGGDDIYTILDQDFNDRFADRHVQNLPRTYYLDVEGEVLFGFVVFHNLKKFPFDARNLNVHGNCRLSYPIDKAGWATHINSSIGGQPTCAGRLQRQMQYFVRFHFAFGHSNTKPF